MADSNNSPVDRALASLKRPVIETSEDIHPDHHQPVEKKIDYNALAREHAAGPVRHSNGKKTTR